MPSPGAGARDEDVERGVQKARLLFQAIHVEILVQGQVIALRDDERVHSGEHGRVLHDLVPALGDTQQHDAGVGAGIEVGGHTRLPMFSRNR